MADDEPSDKKTAAEKQMAEFRARVQALQARPDEDGHVDSEPEKTPTERRVQFIYMMMCDGTWVSGRSDRLLAEAWSLSRSRVWELSAEAGRLFKRLMQDTPEDREAMRQRVAQTFERLASKAETLGTANALAVAGSQVALMAEYLGLKPAQRLEHTGADGSPLAPARVIVLPDKDPVPDEPEA